MPQSEKSTLKRTLLVPSDCRCRPGVSAGDRGPENRRERLLTRPSAGAHPRLPNAVRLVVSSNAVMSGSSDRRTRSPLLSVSSRRRISETLSSSLARRHRGHAETRVVAPKVRVVPVTHRGSAAPRGKWKATAPVHAAPTRFCTHRVYGIVERD